MGKPTEGIVGGDERQSLCNRLLQVFAGASTHPPQKGLQFRESFLTRREIWRIRRQKHETTAFGFDGLPHPASQMNTEIIQEPDLSWVQAGSEDLLNVDSKGRAICGSIQDECFSHALYRQGSKQGHVRSIIARDLAHGSLSAGRVGVQRGHGKMGTRFIHKHQILTGEVARLFAPGDACCFILFSGYEGLFFRVQPRAALARLMLAGLTSMPCSALNRWQCSSRVASGWVSNCALKLACNIAPFFAGRPGIAFGTT
jgi:hypothetical protein